MSKTKSVHQKLNLTAIAVGALLVAGGQAAHASSFKDTLTDQQRYQICSPVPVGTVVALQVTNSDGSTSVQKVHCEHEDQVSPSSSGSSDSLGILTDDSNDSPDSATDDSNDDHGSSSGSGGSGSSGSSDHEDSGSSGSHDSGGGSSDNGGSDD